MNLHPEITGDGKVSETGHMALKPKDTQLCECVCFIVCAFL